MWKLALSLLLFLSHRHICLSSDPLADEYGELVFVSLLYRHGDRAITGESYPTDPYKNETYWSVGYGQLTNEGKKRHFELGKWLRNRYQDFLPAIYSPDDIYIHSTSVDRAIMSAGSNLAGLYPPVGNQTWNADLGKLWQPIPIHSLSPLEDNVLTYGDNCPRYRREFLKVLNSTEVRKFNKKHEELYSYIKKHTGMKMKNQIYDVQFLYDVLLVETQYNYTLPNWTNSVYPEKLMEVSRKSFELQTHNSLLKKLCVGMLIKEIVINMNIKRNSTIKSSKKLWMYSAHDSNVAALLNALNVYNNELPPYAATVLFELRKNQTNSSSYVVTVSYKNSSTHDPYLLHIPGCDSVACELDQFIDVVKPNFIDNWHEECHKEITSNKRLWFYGVTIVFLLFVFIIFFVVNRKAFLCYCGRDYQKF
ncbi:prostatic acid phosphatase-like isoform X2 [Adelges cooleyi]|uniref:prostatic acid phosphatase-like isoform X2 n=1 Tax=Adelges cooleyi TaxID=133065 RepID=UPI0021809A45|nr:prostatic acid phosphatase-like isoform X2 [Adelges cooleyi]